MLTKRAQVTTLEPMAPTPPRHITINWPDREAGPWEVQMWWRVQHGVPVPVGLSITGWHRSGEELMQEARALEMVEQDLGGPGRYSQLPVATAEVEFPRMTAALLRSLPVGRLFQVAREALVSNLRLDLPDADLTWWPPGHQQAVERWNEHHAPERDALSAPRAGRDLGDDHYREVARVYTEAVQAGASPTKAVEERFTISKSAAGKQVARARERGLLPKTSRGRVGPLQEEL